MAALQHRHSATTAMSLLLPLAPEEEDSPYATLLHPPPRLGEGAPDRRIERAAAGRSEEGGEEDGGICATGLEIHSEKDK